VLKAMARLYMEKHLAVHRPSGAFEFFMQEANRYKRDLALIETQLAQFGQKEHLVTEGTEKEITVRKLGDYAASLLDTKTAIAATEARIRSLQALARSTEPRQTKVVRTSPNAALKELQTQLVALEMKRTDMLGKFQPTYRPLQDLDSQIQGLKNTIADLEKTPLIEETTDTNPANDWLRVELARTRSELASLQASAPAKERAVNEYRSEEHPALGSDPAAKSNRRKVFAVPAKTGRSADRAGVGSTADSQCCHCATTDGSDSAAAFVDDGQTRFLRSVCGNVEPRRRLRSGSLQSHIPHQR
jgi:chromosome segregation ATPase